MNDSDSEEEIDQLEQIRNANVKPGMFVSGWEDPNDEVYEVQNPHGKLFSFLTIFLSLFSIIEILIVFFSSINKKKIITDRNATKRNPLGSKRRKNRFSPKYSRT